MPKCAARRHITAVAAVVLATLLATNMALALPASSQNQGSPPTSGQTAVSAVLVSQSEWSIDQPFQMQTRVDGAINLDRTEFVVTVYDRVLTRSQFTQTLEEQQLGSSIILERQRLSAVLGPDNVIRTELPIQDSEQTRYFLADAGVYPVRVELRSLDQAQSIDSFVTHIINVPNPPDQDNRLLVTPVMQVRAPVDDVVTDPLNLPDNGASVARLASALGTYGSMPMVLDVAPETIERLAGSDDADVQRIADQLAEVQNGRPVVRSAWTEIGAPVFSDEMGGELDRQMDRGQAVLKENFSTVSSELTVLRQPIGADGVAAFNERGAERVLVAEQALVPQSRLTTLARPFSLSTGYGATPIPAVQIDGPSSAHFLDDEGPVLGAHRLLADLAVVYNDLPGVRRGVAVGPPAEWRASREFLDVYLRGIANSPVIQPASVDQVFDLTNEASPAGSVRQLALDTESVDDFPYDRALELRRQIDGYATVADPDSDQLDRLRRHLLSAQSALIPNFRRNEAFDAVQGGVNRQLGALRLPSDRSIRLTARIGEIPISVQNDTGEAVNVIVRLDSDRLSFPEGSARTIRVERQQVTETFVVNARTSGVFPVQVRVESPDGSLVLAESRISVSSTATSNVGVFLSIGAGAFLLLWWLRSIVKARRPR